MGDEHEKNINTKNKGTQSWGANIFTAKSNELLKTVSSYTTDSSCNYDIYIDPVSGSTNQNDQVFSKNESASVAGYYIIPLDFDIWLTVSQNFSVVLNLTNLEYGYPIAIEGPLSGDDIDSSKATANSGKGFISSSEGTWEDIAIDFPNTNVCIKAFIDSYISEFLGYTNPPADSDHVVSMRISMETEKWILIM